VTNPYKVTLALFALVFSALFSATATAATTPPKVVFVGDYITEFWTNGFATNSNWVNASIPGYPYDGNYSATAGAILASFQSKVVSMHPAIVHILIGAGDAQQIHDSTYQTVITEFLANLNTMVQEAKAADIKVILGLEPTAVGVPNQLNAVIVTYGAANNIPVINYADALCGCINSLNSGSLWLTSSYMIPAPIEPGPYPNPLIPSPAGYALMAEMANNTIWDMTQKLVTGWLSNVQQYNDNEGINYPPPTNVNTVYPQAVMLFTPVGYYRDGTTHPMLNTTFQGVSGTWTSSNPEVMYINQDGLAWALTTGKAIVHYSSPSGVVFSEWVMTVLPSISS